MSITELQKMVSINLSSFSSPWCLFKCYFLFVMLYNPHDWQIYPDYYCTDSVAVPLSGIFWLSGDLYIESTGSLGTDVSTFSWQESKWVYYPEWQTLPSLLLKTLSDIETFFCYFRCISPELKSLALGMQTLATRSLGKLHCFQVHVKYNFT